MVQAPDPQHASPSGERVADIWHRRIAGGKCTYSIMTNGRAAPTQAVRPCVPSSLSVANAAAQS